MHAACRTARRGRSWSGTETGRHRCLWQCRRLMQGLAGRRQRLRVVPIMSDDRRVVIIGSGPAGAMAALTLVHHGIPVTMLESGEAMPRGLLVRAAGRNLVRK